MESLDDQCISHKFISAFCVHFTAILVLVPQFNRLEPKKSAPNSINSLTPFELHIRLQPQVTGKYQTFHTTPVPVKNEVVVDDMTA